MYDVSGKLLNGIKSMYVNNIASVRVKRYESDCFRINSDVRQNCIISPLLFNVYMFNVYISCSMWKWGGGGIEVKFLEE